MRPRRTCNQCDIAYEGRRKRKIEPRLTSAEQLKVDGCQETAINLRPVLDAAREVDGKAATQCV